MTTRLLPGNLVWAPSGKPPARPRTLSTRKLRSRLVEFSIRDNRSRSRRRTLSFFIHQHRKTKTDEPHCLHPTPIYLLARPCVRHA